MCVCESVSVRVYAATDQSNLIACVQAPNFDFCAAD